MSKVDLADKAIYDMLGDNQKVVVPEHAEQVAQPAQVAQVAQPAQPVQSKKMVRSFKGFVVFAVVVILIAAFIYFTIYRLGWGVSECVKGNYHDCAALLTPEVAPLAATGILALL